ncbi:potassium channel subfamily K member 16-like [Strongylocentrotus purpuratus]|uniref:Potassium channel domain-containing protein n=1 Tax=Strongylocentrotus purpuratus TaxID=7668 RepID=A0A7M7PTU6_STRPU|nr:potassium channel subfamily K member 16-like [Strongylocentrotus purpuratus]
MRVSYTGYGNISPSTRGGQSFTIFYALIGIPLCCVVLAQMGTKINAKVKLLIDRISECFGQYEMKSWMLPAIQGILLTTFLLGFGLIIPAAAFSVTEGWSFHEAWYYCFITVTTIGFGDYVIGTNSDIPYTVVYKWFSLLWIFFGLIVMATIISKMTDWLSEKTEKAQVFVKQGQEKEGGEMESDDSRGKLNGNGGEENVDKDVEMNTVLNGQD